MARTPLFSRQQPGGLFSIADVGQHPGEIYWVHSGTGSTGGGQSPDAPITTIDAAIGLCTASKGDVIYVMPGHTETITGVAAIAMDVAGVNVVGLGNGRNRPLITWGGTTTTWAVTAANCSIRNIRTTAGVNSVVSLFTVTAGGLTLDAVDYEATAACQALGFILTTAGGVDLTVQNCRWVSTGTIAASVQAWITLVGADRAKIHNNFAQLYGAATAAANGVIVGATTASLDVEITNNRFVCTNSTSAVPISLLTATTGIVDGNRVASPKTAIAGSIAIASCYGGQNYAAHVVNKSGLLDPVVDA